MKRFLNSRILICSLAVTVVLGSILLGPSVYRKVAARYYLREGLKAYTAKDYQTAETCFVQAKRLDATLIEAQVGLVKLYNLTTPEPVSTSMYRDLAGRRLDVVSELLRIDPSNRYGLSAMAQSCFAMQDWQEAKGWWQRWAVLYPSDYEPLYRIGTANWQLLCDPAGPYGPPAPRAESERVARLVSLADEGIAALKEAIRRKPDHVDSYAYLALLYQQKSELAREPVERKRWLREADLTALAAAKLRKPD